MKTVSKTSMKPAAGKPGASYVTGQAIELCPEACTVVQADVSARLDVEYGCPPRFDDRDVVGDLRAGSQGPLSRVTHGVAIDEGALHSRGMAHENTEKQPKQNANEARDPVVVAPGKGRVYAMGALDAIFKADGDETRGRYSISEWWLEPHTRGPGAHSHEEDDVFFVIEGTMSFFVGGAWIDAPKGSLVIAPGGTLHDFENRTATRAGALNISVPGNFEPQMESIAEWFRARPAAEARTENAPRTTRAQG